MLQIAKVAERSFADRVLLPVTAAIYRNGEEKPAMRWSLEMGIGGESDKNLFDLIFRVREGFGIGTFHFLSAPPLRMAGIRTLNFLSVLFEK